MKKILFSILFIFFTCLWFYTTSWGATTAPEEENPVKERLQFLQTQLSLQRDHLEREEKALSDIQSSFSTTFSSSIHTSLSDVLSALSEFPKPARTYMKLLVLDDRRNHEQQALFIRLQGYLDSLGKDTGLAAYGTFERGKLLVRQIRCYIENLKQTIQKIQDASES